MTTTRPSLGGWRLDTADWRPDTVSQCSGPNGSDHSGMITGWPPRPGNVPGRSASRRDGSVSPGLEGVRSPRSASAVWRGGSGWHSPPVPWSGKGFPGERPPRSSPLLGRKSVRAPGGGGLTAGFRVSHRFPRFWSRPLAGCDRRSSARRGWSGERVSGPSPFSVGTRPGRGRGRFGRVPPGCVWVSFPFPAGCYMPVISVPRSVSRPCRSAGDRGRTVARVAGTARVGSRADRPMAAEVSTGARDRDTAVVAALSLIHI